MISFFFVRIVAFCQSLPDLIIKMPPQLQPPASFHLQAAQGWLELGNPAEAVKELEKISPELLAHPDVLHVSWEIQAATRDWEGAVETAARLIQVDPESPVGWVHRSYSLHELKRTEEARESLLRVVDKFPQDATMRYNIACYECRLGRLDKAREWLRKAFALRGGRILKLAAHEDPDLKPLWSDLKDGSG